MAESPQPSVLSNPPEVNAAPIIPAASHKSKLTPFLVILLMVAAVSIGSFLLAKSLYEPKTATPLLPSPINQPPTPTPDPTVNWKTYTNTENGFSFPYPKNWIISDCMGDNKKCEGANNIVEVRPPNSQQTNLLDGFSVEIFGTIYCPSTINSARNVWKWETFKESEYKVLENKGVLFEGSSQFPDNRFYTRKLVLIENNNKCFNISSLYSNKLTDSETFDQILSTFKFTSL